MNFLFLAVFDVAWMVLYDFTAEHLAVYMGIDFRRGNALVAQHALDGSQVGTSFQQVGGKGVAEGVWTDVLVMPALSASSLMRWNTMMRERLLPQRARKRQSSCPALILQCLLSSSQ